MLDAWLSTKGNLYARHSTFACDKACPRYGCQGDLLVTTSLLEICVLARRSGQAPLGAFDRYYRIVPYTGDNPATTRVRFILRKPCPFLNNDGYCGVYALRPAACALFPEFLSLYPDKENYIKENSLGLFPCIEHFSDVSEARRETLESLWSMHRKELYLDDIYLFGYAGFRIDIREAVSMLTSGSMNGVSFLLQTDALHVALKSEGWWERIYEKIRALDTDDGLRTLISGMKIVEALNL